MTIPVYSIGTEYQISSRQIQITKDSKLKDIIRKGQKAFTSYVIFEFRKKTFIFKLQGLKIKQIKTNLSAEDIIVKYRQTTS